MAAMRTLRLLALLLAAGLVCSAADANDVGATAPPGRHDVFNQVQRNAWYLPTTDHVAKLFVTEIGQGAPVVFLHGGPGRDFHYIIDALRPQLERHAFVLYDQRGSVLSPVPAGTEGKLTMRQMVDDLEALRIALGRDRLVLFGHSFGSLLAMAYYRAYPTHVERMVLAGSMPPVMDQAMSDAYNKALEQRETAMMAREDAIARALAEAGLPSDKHRDTPRQARMRLRIRYNAPLDLVHVERWHQLTSGGIYYNHAAGAAIAASMPTWDVRPAVDAHPVPITVIQGDSDYLDPAAHLWSALAKAGKVRVHVIHDAGHCAWIDQPQAFAAALRDGLDGR
jgi:proline-specific peptidase